MKKLVSMLLALALLSVCLSGCGGSSDKSNENDINSIVRTHDAKNDVIKFDNIEWSEEVDIAKEKIIKDLEITEDIDISNYTLSKKDECGFDREIINISKEGEKHKIGKLAGWEISAIRMDCYMIDNKEYISDYQIEISGMDGENIYDEIAKDIIEKLDKKYKDLTTKSSDDRYNTTYTDDNNNEIRIDAGKEGIYIIYMCNDAIDYLKRTEQEYLNRIKKEKKEDSKGL